MSSYEVEGVPRYEAPNHFNYTDEEKLEKQEWMEKLIRLNPKVAPLHIEWIYDLCKRTPQDELEAMKERILASEKDYMNGKVKRSQEE